MISHGFMTPPLLLCSHPDSIKGQNYNKDGSVSCFSVLADTGLLAPVPQLRSLLTALFRKSGEAFALHEKRREIFKRKDGKVAG
jgi:hypothetical protein